MRLMGPDRPKVEALDAAKFHLLPPLPRRRDAVRTEPVSEERFNFSTGDSTRRVVAPLVEKVAPGRVVAGDARVEHQIVVAARDRQWVELDRAEPAKYLQDRLHATRKRPRRSEEVPGHEESTRALARDLHEGDAIARLLP